MKTVHSIVTTTIVQAMFQDKAAPNNIQRRFHIELFGLL